MSVESSMRRIQKRSAVESFKRLFYNPQVDSVGMKLAIIVNDFSYWIWRLTHPGKSFADFYAWQVIRKLERGHAHKSLGKRRLNQDSLLSKPGEQDSPSISVDGRAEFAELLKLGLQSGQKVVEYGCGSLRVGRYCIELLEPEHYVGMDITDRFFNDGKAILDHGLIAEKRPDFHVINDHSLKTVAAWKPDFIYAAAVTQHVPPSELGQYFQRLAQIKHAGARLAVFFVAADRQTRLKGKSWTYEPSQLKEVMAVAFPDAKLTVQACSFNRRETRIKAWEAVIIAE